ncbi:MAG: hypothetical protein HYR75_03140, partial [Gemmatimonadetes bacterium]|nr:hypothetical protein [Gemmatimonadota bacterium]
MSRLPHTGTAGVLLLSLAACVTTSTTPAPSRHDRALLLDPADAEWTRHAPAVSHLRFATTKGEFVLELRRDWGPIGA